MVTLHQKPWLPPGHLYMLRVCFGHQHPGDSEQLQEQNGLLFPWLGGEGCASLSTHGAQWGTLAPCTS